MQNAFTPSMVTPGAHRSTVLSPALATFMSPATVAPFNADKGTAAPLCRMCRYRIVSTVLSDSRDERDQLLRDLDAENRWLSQQVKVMQQHITELTRRCDEAASSVAMIPSTAGIPSHGATPETTCRPGELTANATPLGNYRLSVVNGRVVADTNGASRPIVDWVARTR